ncbi:hypothetical protein TH66_06595 [Carbonactinospora thermoautotrophica]|uniref:Uncharacterized protein n=2 Tax=Carbonactinospora thermoautotrophica TaxID=1469144 RepID=A0A132N3W3_9ACTN|nr:hypothetical protein [Carbonactinospora thermoautotrophica]KWX04819.1 hypothetical protein TH66_06595 [Carbonactinospora thermoautotrophica]KWX06774.1 hypothetical protein TR74_21035 [Carbonactinospora thermoautotrophica]
MTAYGDEDHDQARHIESEDWDKALEEFCRDAHWAEGALVLTPFQDGESASLLDPVFAITVGEHTEVVSAEWSYLLGRLDGGDDWLALHQQLRAASWWAALDGPQALVRLTVRVTQPVPANVRLLLPAEGHRHILDVPARGGVIGLLPSRNAVWLEESTSVADTLTRMLLVPSAPSVSLRTLLDAHGWR